ncbi:50S ribosomal protein L29 [Candidatus Peregrinibacteria bacterium]|nr:50S ribosomal protein L29 [Candidatus Peregrinibacteria bacterium]
MKTLEELKKLDDQKLTDELKSLIKDLFKVKFEVDNGQSKNIHKIGLLKKQIARVHTLKKERELLAPNNQAV